MGFIFSSDTLGFLIIGTGILRTEIGWEMESRPPPPPFQGPLLDSEGGTAPYQVGHKENKLLVNRSVNIITTTTTTTTTTIIIIIITIIIIIIIMMMMMMMIF